MTSDLAVTPEAVTSAEVREMRDAIATMVGSLHGDDDPRLDPPTDEDRRASWRRLATEHSLLGLHQPVECGGQAQPFVFSALVAEAMGQHLARSPFLASQSLAAPVLLAGASAEQLDRILTPILEGAATAALAGADAGLVGGAGRPALTRGPDGPRLTGSTDFVCDAATADWIVVLADVDGSADVAAVVVRPGVEGLTVTDQQSLDTTRVRSRLDFDDTPGEELEALTADGLQLALAEATVLVAAEAVGAAGACLDSTLAYVRIRHQFDRPIGAFQALQHQLADLHGELESARACVAAAATAHGGTDLAEVVEAASLAKSAAADAFVHIARETIHLHGGIGFTWEHDAHLYYKRALGDLALLGGPAEHRRALVASW